MAAAAAAAGGKATEHTRRALTPPRCARNPSLTHPRSRARLACFFSRRPQTWRRLCPSPPAAPAAPLPRLPNAIPPPSTPAHGELRPQSSGGERRTAAPRTAAASAAVRWAELRLPPRRGGDTAVRGPRCRGGRCAARSGWTRAAQAAGPEGEGSGLAASPEGGGGGRGEGRCAALRCRPGRGAACVRLHAEMAAAQAGPGLRGKALGRLPALRPGDEFYRPALGNTNNGDSNRSG